MLVELEQCECVVEEDTMLEIDMHVRNGMPSFC